MLYACMVSWFVQECHAGALVLYWGKCYYHHTMVEVPYTGGPRWGMGIVYGFGYVTVRNSVQDLTSGHVPHYR